MGRWVEDALKFIVLLEGFDPSSNLFVSFEGFDATSPPSRFAHVCCPSSFACRSLPFFVGWLVGWLVLPFFVRLSVVGILPSLLPSFVGRQPFSFGIWS